MEIFKPFTLIFLTIFLTDVHSETVLHIVLKLAFIDISVFKHKISPSFLFTFYPMADVLWSILVLHGAFAVKDLMALLTILIPFDLSGVQRPIDL